MTIEEIMPALRRGEVAGLKYRPDRSYLIISGEWYCREHRWESEFRRSVIDTRELLSDQWEIRPGR